MRLIESGSFPIADIQVGNRLRTVDKEWVNAFAATLNSPTDLQHPIILVKVGNEHRLAAGGHRLAAFTLKGWDDIPAKIMEPETDQPDLEIRQAEIMENLGRRELSPLDRATHVFELHDIWQKLHGEKRGRPSKEKSANVALFDLGDELGDKLGLSRRTVFADVALFSGLSSASRKRITGTWLADNRAQLVVLSKEKPEDQKAVLDLLFKDEEPCANVSAALARHHNKVDVTDPDEAAFAKFVKLWAGASKKVRRNIKAHIEKGSE